MTWYAVHAIVAMRRVDKIGPFSVYENVFLVEANSSAEASAKGAELATCEVNAGDNLTIDDVPAVRSFVGVRKVVSVSNPSPLDLDRDRPVSGTELTYSEYVVDSEEALQKLAAGEAVAVHYVD